MALTILVSFSLLALVVTARPIQFLQDGPQSDASPAVQDIVQAVFRARARQSPECLTCGTEDDIRIQFTSAEEQSDVLSALDDLGAIKGVVPIGLDGVLTDEERKLYDILGSPRPGASLNDLEGGGNSLSEVLAASTSQSDTSRESGEQSAPESSSDGPQYMRPGQMLVLTFSCVAALLSMGCVAIGFYAMRYFSRKVGLEVEWEMIPRVETRDAVEIVVDDDFPNRFRDLKVAQAVDVSQVPSTPPLNTFDLATAESPVHHPQPIVRNPDSDDESDGEEIEEKFHDAEERPFRSMDVATVEKGQKTGLPIIVIEETEDPDYLPLPISRSVTPYSTPPPTPPRSPYRRIVEMREAATSRPASPVSKPAWSVRAADAPALGLTGSDARAAPVPLPLPKRPRPSSPAQPQETLSIPASLPLDAEKEVEMAERPRRASYRTPVPGLDIAFAMQLRPGLGLGSDSAWIVRFLMAMFGWMTVLFGNGGTVMMGRDRRAIQA